VQNISLSELHKQIKTHLECLRISGIEWVENNNNSTSQTSVPIVHDHLPLVSMAGTQNLVVAPPTPVISSLHSLEKKTLLLQQLKDEVASCVKCPQLAQTRKNTVFGIGKIEPDICFVGELQNYFLIVYKLYTDFLNKLHS
jgi:hypothetical protein